MAKTPRKLVVFTEDVLTNDEKRIIEKALDTYRLEGWNYLESAGKDKMEILKFSNLVRDLQSKVWKL